jgi:MFS transporter, UMF1 family
VYQVNVVATYAYMPEIARNVGEARMTDFTATFNICQFGAEALYIVLIVAISTVFALNDVVTAQVSQAINVVWISTAFGLAWYRIPSVPANHTLPPGRSVWTEGFFQVGRTARHIYKDYRKGLRWFLLGVVFAEAAANAYTVVAVVYLTEHINMSSTEVAMFFLITLLASLPGSRLGAYITTKTDPNRSWRLCIWSLIVVTIGGAIIVDLTPKYVSYAWGVCIGVLLGWFYPTEGLFFSMVLPKGQEAEFSGFYVYCTQILGWAPPLLFAGMVEADVNQTYGVMTVALFFVIANVMLMCAAPWHEILQETGSIVQDSDMTVGVAQGIVPAALPQPMTAGVDIESLQHDHHSHAN